jgi:hypothetical protein
VSLQTANAPCVSQPTQPCVEVWVVGPHLFPCSRQSWRPNCQVVNPHHVEPCTGILWTGFATRQPGPLVQVGEAGLEWVRLPSLQPSLGTIPSVHSHAPLLGQAMASVCNIRASCMCVLVCVCVPSNTLRGTLPPRLQWFKLLRYLRLSNNAITGTLPRLVLRVLKDLT